MSHSSEPVSEPVSEAEQNLTAEPIEFGADGETIRGTLYLPPDAGAPEAGDAPGAAAGLPGVVLAHGWSMVAGGDLEDYARRVAARGIVCLTFDFRRLGRSDGLPRQEIDPHGQIEDYRTAVTYLASRPEVDSRRMGIWGTSYSGGHALVVAASDDRVTCVVSQVPTISGYLSGLRKTRPRDVAAQRAAFNADRLARLGGAAPGVLATVGPDTETNVAYPGADSYDYMMSQAARCPEWRNETTLRSLEAARTYEPGNWISRIGPKPLLMIVADHDTQTPTDMQLDAFTKAREPKKLLLVRGGHYSVYREWFEETSTAAADWFEEHL
ncbi:alpha/beta hydrolase [Streptomyces sp. NPDC004838]